MTNAEAHHKKLRTILRKIITTMNETRLTTISARFFRSLKFGTPKVRTYLKCFRLQQNENWPLAD